MRPRTATYIGTACRRCGCVERFCSNRSCCDCQRYRNGVPKPDGNSAEAALGRITRRERELEEEAHEEHALAAHRRVPSVFHWRGPRP